MGSGGATTAANSAINDRVWKKHPFLYCKKKKRKKKEEEYKRSLSLGVQGRDFTDR
jgi:hypothetical protein